MRSPADDASRFRYFRRISYPYFGDSALNYLHARGHRDEQSAGQYVLVLFEPSCYAPRPLFLEAERPMTDQTTRGIAAATSGGRRPRQRRTRSRPAARPVIGPEKQKTHIQPCERVAVWALVPGLPPACPGPLSTLQRRRDLCAGRTPIIRHSSGGWSLGRQGRAQVSRDSRFRSKSGKEATARRSKPCPKKTWPSPKHP